VRPAILALSAVLVAVPARAADGDAAALKRAEALFSDAQYADAVAALDEVLARGTLDATSRREATLYLGMSHLALGHDDAARARFREVLTDDVAYALPRYTSPKIRAAFERVRDEVRSAPRLSPLGPLIRPSPIGPERVRLRFRAERATDRPATAYWRRRGEATYVAVPLAGADAERAGDVALPARIDTDFDLEYYAEIADGDRVLARAGSREQPLSVRVHAGVAGPSLVSVPKAEERPPIYKRWWFWTAVGAVVAGGAVAAYALTRSDTAAAGELDIHFMVAP
jgi:hypothetical protein